MFFPATFEHIHDTVSTFNVYFEQLFGHWDKHLSFLKPPNSDVMFKKIGGFDKLKTDCAQDYKKRVMK